MSSNKPFTSDYSDLVSPTQSDDKDANKVYTVKATSASTGELVDLSYTRCTVVGSGSFGVVMRAEIIKGDSGFVALKRTRQDKRFKNRELQVMQALSHPNIAALRFWYHEATAPSSDEVYLNLVIEFVPETIYRQVPLLSLPNISLTPDIRQTRTYRTFTKKRQAFPEFHIKLYMHQLFRSISYVHALGICHRDIKPHNLMIDPDSGVLKIIDWGSAKVLREGQPNVSYTCSRYYRAPELIFGSTRYSNAIDLWSIGCVLAELLQGSVFFPGTSGIDQLVEIIKTLGTPTKEQIKMMNPSYMEHKFPKISSQPLSKILTKSSPDSLSLLSRLLVFDPTQRISECEALAHPFFDELKVPNKKMPNDKPLPNLFNFTRHELSIRPDLIRQIVPPHAEKKLWEESKIDISSFEPVDLKKFVVNID